MSDHHSHRFRKLTATLLLFAVAACGEGGESESEAAPAPPVPQAGPPIEMAPLTDAELLGVDRAQVLINLPWSNQTLVKSPASDAARATLHSVEIAEGPSFDRASFTFGDDAAFPGYRVIWNDSLAAGCGGDPARIRPGDWVLSVAFDPATAVDGSGRPMVAERSRRPGLPAIEGATQACDRANRLVWTLAAADSSLVRVVEMRDPPRLLVDVMHPGATAP